MAHARWIRKKNGVEIYKLIDSVNSFPPHFHKYGLVGRLLRGKRLIRVNGQSRLLSPGDIVIIKPGEVHSCDKIGEESNMWLAVTIPARFFPAAGIPNFPHLNKSAYGDCEALFNNLESGDPASLISRLSDLKGEVKLPGSPDKRFALLLGEMEKRMAGKFDTAEMARMTKMDKYGLIRKFSATFCLTPHKYIASLRVAMGCELLSQGRDISDSALRIGFYDQSHFTSLFHRYMGATPALYKNAGEGRLTDLNI